MASTTLTPAKVFLLAVQAATTADIGALRTLVAGYQSVVQNSFLRILLTFLPESVPSSDYIELLAEFSSGKVSPTPNVAIDTSIIDHSNNDEALSQAKKVRLLPLRMQDRHLDAPDDPLLSFLLHRAYQIDSQSGMIDQLPTLLNPFIDRYDYLRKWFLGSVLPLLRLEYEYHPNYTTLHTISWFEGLTTKDAVEFLLSRALPTDIPTTNGINFLLRDLRGLIGPWLYGCNQWARQQAASAQYAGQTVRPLDDVADDSTQSFFDWQVVFRWLISQTEQFPSILPATVIKWQGPGDVDLGGYGQADQIINGADQKVLQGYYGNCGLVIAVKTAETTGASLQTAATVESIVRSRLGLPPLAELQRSVVQLEPIPNLGDDTSTEQEQIVSSLSYLSGEIPAFKIPSDATFAVFQAMLITGSLLKHIDSAFPLERVGDLMIRLDEHNQRSAMSLYMGEAVKGATGNDRQWTRMRQEVLWLHDWGRKFKVEEGAIPHKGRGILGILTVEQIESTFLSYMLENTRYALARSIYEDAMDKPLTQKEVEKVVLEIAEKAYMTANNPSVTTGGIRKCLDILDSFPKTTEQSTLAKRLRHLCQAVRHIGKYRLVLSNLDQPFAPRMLATYHDPIDMIARLLAQNTRVYTDVDNFFEFGKHAVLAGLTIQHENDIAEMEEDWEDLELKKARWRIASLCIEAALTEDDFESAYSFVVNRLPTIAGDPYPETTPTDDEDPLSAEEIAQIPFQNQDSWSWKVAFLTGKYRLNEYTIKPSHVGNASANPEIRHQEQRMECISVALRLCPPSAMQEILNVFRRCEEELEAKITEEAEQEAAWDEDKAQKVIPGKFDMDAPVTLSRAGAASGSAKSRVGEEAPMSLFDLTRASAAQAQRSLAALGVGKQGTAPQRGSSESERTAGVDKATVRKRDQLRSAAVGTLAGGIGWLIGAPSIPPRNDDTVENDDNEK